nr:hypothetical protein CFP56_23196 [Quercus suber]
MSNSQAALRKKDRRFLAQHFSHSKHQNLCKKTTNWYEDSDEDDSSIRTFITARLDAANAGGCSAQLAMVKEVEDQDGESELLHHS